MALQNYIPSGSAPPLTIGQAENSSDTTEGTIDGAILQKAVADALSGAPVAVAISTVGQTTIPLPRVPLTPAAVKLSVNGITYRAPTDFSITGSLLTWASEFALTPYDSVFLLNS